MRGLGLSRHSAREMSDIRSLRQFFWSPSDLPLRAELRLLDRIAGPHRKTAADRAREDPAERLRRTFPDSDIDGHRAASQKVISPD